MAKDGLTPSERAAKAEQSRKAALSRIKGLQEQVEAGKTKAKQLAAKARGIMAQRGVQQLGASVAGGALAGGATALVQRYGGGLGDTVGEYMADDRFAGAVVGAMGGLAAVMLDRGPAKKGKQAMLDVACGAAAGGAAIATRPVVAGMLPEAVPVAGLRYAPRQYIPAPVQVQGLRLGFEPPRRPAQYRPAAANAFR